MAEREDNDNSNYRIAEEDDGNYYSSPPAKRMKLGK
jgi:hypothetical protein